MKQNKLTNPEIVVVAVARLGGDAESIDTEDIAIEAYNIAPGKFGWRKYPERIDLDQVRRALSSSASAKPPLLSGDVRRGWMLSKHGLNWIENNMREVPALESYRRGSVSDAIEMERSRLRETRAWQKYKSQATDQINLNDFFEFVRINEYFSEAKRHERCNIVARAVENDAELVQLWRILQQQFPEQMEKSNG
jgi:hypothetical protein